MTVVAPWVRQSGLAAIVAALPTIVWRVIVGLGPTLGTPASWRARESLPGSGTGYVIFLSVLELVAAPLTTVLFVPRIGRWFPRPLILVGSSLGAVALVAVCVLSCVHWGNVDPFGDATTTGAWAYLCWGCYAAALLWPVFLIATIAGYARSTGRRQLSEM